MSDVPMLEVRVNEAIRRCEQAIETVASVKQSLEQLLPTLPSEEHVGRTEKVAIQLWRAVAEHEHDWEGEPYTNDDWLKLTIESEREDYRKRANHLLREIRS